MGSRLATRPAAAAPRTRQGWIVRYWRWGGDQLHSVIISSTRGDLEGLRRRLDQCRAVAIAGASMFDADRQRWLPVPWGGGR